MSKMSSKLPDSARIEAAIATANKSEAHAFARAFSQRHREEDGTGWDLLANIFDFHFRHENADQPFGPMVIMNGKRSMIPEDLTDEQLNALRCNLDTVADPEYRARIGDVLWLRRRDSPAARTAIEGYISSGTRLEDPDHWVLSMERYERAIRLARQLGRQEPLYERALAHLETRVRYYNGQDKLFFTCHGLSLLYEFRAGSPKELAAIAGKAARGALAERDFRRARDYYELEIKFHRRAGAMAEALSAQTAHAECFVEEAEQREAAGSFMTAHTFWNDAIQAFRHIPTERHRIPELHRRLNHAGERMRDEMGTFSTEIDLSEPIANTKARMSGLPFDEAFFRFVVIEPTIDPAELRKQAERIIQDSPLRAAVSASIYDAAGRKVDERPPALTDDPEQREQAIRGFMDEHAGIHRFIAVRGCLAPAMSVLLEEHQIDEAQIQTLVEGTTFIPNGHLVLFVRGMRYGFQWDFATALHLLVPQVENSLRVLLHINGVITTSLDEVGIEETWPLGKILAEPKSKEILGDDLHYEIRSLLLGRPGENIRNLLAHGLLTSAALSGENAFYLWWLILRLIVLLSPKFQAFAERVQNQTLSEGASRPK